MTLMMPGSGFGSLTFLMPGSGLGSLNSRLQLHINIGHFPTICRVCVPKFMLNCIISGPRKIRNVRSTSCCSCIWTK